MIRQQTVRNLFFEYYITLSAVVKPFSLLFRQRGRGNKENRPANSIKTYAFRVIYVYLCFLRFFSRAISRHDDERSDRRVASDFLCLSLFSPIFQPGDFPARRRTIRSQSGIRFTLVSKGLRGPFVTSHNIYYVKSDIPERPHGYFYIILYLNMLYNMNTGVVNNFSTTFGNKQGFRAQTPK